MGVCRSRFYYEKKGERFWRSIKQDYIYLNPTADVKELRSGIDKWIRFYNYERPHQGLKGNVPTAVYMEAA